MVDGISHQFVCLSCATALLDSVRPCEVPCAWCQVVPQEAGALPTELKAERREERIPSNVRCSGSFAPN